MSLPDELQRVERLTGEPPHTVVMHGDSGLGGMVWINESAAVFSKEVRPGEIRLLNKHGQCVSITNTDVDE